MYIVQRIFRTFSSYITETLYSLNNSVFPCVPHLHLSLVTTILLFVSMSLIILDTACKWNPAVFVFYDWLISQHNNNTHTHTTNTHCILFIHSSIDGHSCCFHTLAVNMGDLFLKAIWIFLLQIYSTLWEKI